MIEKNWQARAEFGNVVRIDVDIFSLETSIRKEFKEKEKEQIVIDNIFLLTELTCEIILFCL